MRRAWMVSLVCSVMLTGCPDNAVEDKQDTSSMMDTETADSTVADGDVGGSDGDVGGDDAGGVDPLKLQVRFDPEASGFYRVPWPSDARLTEQGSPDLSDFPNISVELLDAYRAEIESDAFGYSNMPVIYFAFDQEVPPEALVGSVTTTVFTSPVQLIDVSEAGCGERIPVEMQFNTQRDRYLDDNVLQLAPEIGAALKPGGTYAAVVMKSFGRSSGQETLRPEGFDTALTDTTGATPFGASLEPLRQCAAGASLNLDDVAVATVFSTQEARPPMVKLRDAVMDSALATRAVTEWKRSEAWTRRGRVTTWVGLAEFPVFQEGTTPYSAIGSGGALIFDEQGAPVVQRWEQVPIAVSMAGFATPLDGQPRPVLMFLDGTGWEPWNHLRDNWLELALAEGYVVASFMPQFHGDRAGTEWSREQAQTLSFNFLNPPAGRSNFRQQAVEVSYFIRVIREQIPGLDGMPDLNTQSLVYGGHSQGALAGALNAAFESEITSYIFSGLSSYLSLTLLFRKDITDFEAAIKLVFGLARDLDRFHPSIALFQLGAEVVDTYNYTRDWKGSSDVPDGNHIFVTNGAEDATTTQRGMDHLTIMSDLQPLNHNRSWEIDPVGVGRPESILLPVEGNATSFSEARPLTVATYLDIDQGHGTIYGRTLARELAISFWNTSLVGTPRLALTTEYSQFCGNGHDDDEDGLIDCSDPDCDGKTACIETECADGVDNDGNGPVDCDDPSCEKREGCYETSCTDEEDNDGDELIDCDDPDCTDRKGCAEADCADEIDNDGDELIDCDDSNCARSSKCIEFRCTDKLDSDGDGLTDCDDPDCQGGNTCIEWRCDDGVDNDGNGPMDCEDVACLRDQDACPLALETVCDDSNDDDGDNLVDCDDPNCALDPACTPANTTCADADLGEATGFPVIVTTLEEEGPSSWAPSLCVSLGYGEQSPDVSFSWTAPETRTFAFSTLGSSLDTALEIYPADCNPIELACDDDDRPRETSYLEFAVEAGTSYVIVVSGYDTDDFGEVLLSIY